MKNTKRYKFLFHGKGNMDLKNAKEVLIDFGIKSFKQVRDMKVKNNEKML